MISEILTILIIAIDIIVISDILQKLKADIPKFLWVVCVLVLPGIGAALWYYVQYKAPEQKRLAREKRQRLASKNKAGR